MTAWSFYCCRSFFRHIGDIWMWCLVILLICRHLMILFSSAPLFFAISTLTEIGHWLHVSGFMSLPSPYQLSIYPPLLYVSLQSLKLQNRLRMTHKGDGYPALALEPFCMSLIPWQLLAPTSSSNVLEGSIHEGIVGGQEVRRGLGFWKEGISGFTLLCVIISGSITTLYEVAAIWTRSLYLASNGSFLIIALFPVCTCVSSQTVILKGRKKNNERKKISTCMYYTNVEFPGLMSMTLVGWV